MPADPMPTLVVIPDAGHTDVTRFSPAFDDAVAFLWQHLAGAAAPTPPPPS
jgi:hypothetical protein